MLALSTCGPVLAIGLSYWTIFGSLREIPAETDVLSAITLPWAVLVVRCTVNFFGWRRG